MTPAGVKPGRGLARIVLHQGFEMEIDLRRPATHTCTPTNCELARVVESSPMVDKLVVRSIGLRQRPCSFHAVSRSCQVHIVSNCLGVLRCWQRGTEWAWCMCWWSDLAGGGAEDQVSSGGVSWISSLGAMCGANERAECSRWRGRFRCRKQVRSGQACGDDDPLSLFPLPKRCALAAGCHRGRPRGVSW